MAGVSLAFFSSSDPTGLGGRDWPVYRPRASASRKERRPDLCPDSLARVLGRPHGNSLFRNSNGFCRYDGRGDELAANDVAEAAGLNDLNCLNNRWTRR